VDDGYEQTVNRDDTHDYARLNNGGLSYVTLSQCKYCVSLCVARQFCRRHCKLKVKERYVICIAPRVKCSTSEALSMDHTAFTLQIHHAAFTA